MLWWWTGRIESIRGDEVDRRAALAVRLEDGAVSQWLSAAALLADVAADESPSAFDPEWDVLPVRERHAVLVGLRRVLERCPARGGDVVDRTEESASCCPTRRATTARCEACGDRVVVLADHPGRTTARSRCVRRQYGGFERRSAVEPNRCD